MRLIRTVAAGQGGLITAAQSHACGITKDQVVWLCRRRRWLRLHNGVYLVDAEVRGPDLLRAIVIRAALLSAGPAAVAVLDTAAEIHGIAGLAPTPTVHVSLPGPLARPRRYADLDVRLHQFVLQPDQITLVEGARVTTVARTIADVITRSDRLTAVAILDSCLNRHLLVEPDLGVVRGLMTGHRGAAAARTWIAEADGRAESPLESRVRVRAIAAKLPPDELQYRVVDHSGRIVAIGDLAWLKGGRRIIGEADGVDAHSNPTALYRDRHRQNAIIAAGFVLVRFTWADTLDATTVPDAIRAALSRAP